MSAFTDLQLRPKRMPVRAIDEALFSRATARWLEGGGPRIRTWSWGDTEAPTTLLVHGWSGCGAQLAPFVEPLDGLPILALEPSALAAAFDDPALLLHDRADREVPFSESELLAKEWPAATLVEVTGLGHRRILEAPRIIEQVLEFLG